MTQIYIDESGDEGFKFDRGSSDLFCLAALIFASADIAQDCQKAVVQLRQELGLPATREFHFKRDSSPIKKAVLKMLSDWDFSYFGVVVEKVKLNPSEFKKTSSLRIYALELLVDMLVDHIENSTLVIDECGGQKTSKLLRNSIQQRARKVGDDLVKRVHFKRTGSNDLLQMADVVVSSINHSFTRAEGLGKYHRMITDREIAVEVWPKMYPSA